MLVKPQNLRVGDYVDIDGVFRYVEGTEATPFDTTLVFYKTMIDGKRVIAHYEFTNKYTVRRLP